MQLRIPVQIHYMVFCSYKIYLGLLFLFVSAAFLLCMHLDVLILRSVLFGPGTTWGLNF
jgi:hypothetical protein